MKLSECSSISSLRIGQIVYSHSTKNLGFFYGLSSPPRDRSESVDILWDSGSVSEGVFLEFGDALEIFPLYLTSKEYLGIREISKTLERHRKAIESLINLDLRIKNFYQPEK